MIKKISIICLKSQFKNLYARKVVYMVLAPIMTGFLGYSLLLNSYSFFLSCVLCYFFVVDAIAIPGPGIIADISRFYFISKSMINIYIDYIFYRLLTGFVLNYIPALSVFLFISSVLPDEVNHLPIGLSVLIFSAVWAFYMIASLPMLVLAFRKRAFYQLYGLFGIPFYSIGLIAQLELTWKMPVVQDYLVFVWVLIATVFMVMGISFIKLLKSEVVYPETQYQKLGF